MKKSIYLFGILFSIVFSFTSCEDELDQKFNNAFAPESFYSSQDFEFATRALYSGLFSGSYYGGSFLSRQIL